MRNNSQLSESREKVYLVAITSVFGPEAAENLLTVCRETPNIDMAIDILLGTYEEPEFSKTPGPKFLKSNTERINIVFNSFDTFREEIKFSYLKKDAQTIYYSKEIYDSEEKAKFAYNAGKRGKTEGFGFSFDDSFRNVKETTTKRTSSTSLEDWSK